MKFYWMLNYVQVDAAGVLVCGCCTFLFVLNNVVLIHICFTAEY